MKWFKHMSDAHMDEKLDEIIDEFGFEGYGRWWQILEIIAKQMDSSNRCHVVYSWNKWQTFLKGKRNKLKTFLERLENVSLLNLEENGNKLKIECPKLLKLRDNYTKDLEAKKEETLSKNSKQEEEEEVEVEVNIEQDEKSPKTPFEKIRKSWNEILGNNLGCVRSITDQRKKHIRARITDTEALQNHESWIELFEYIAASQFLTGAGPANPNTGKAWKADFDWVINPNNMNKILEGKYHRESV